MKKYIFILASITLGALAMTGFISSSNEKKGAKSFEKAPPPTYKYKIVVRRIISKLEIQLGYRDIFHKLTDLPANNNNEIVPPLEIDITNQLQPTIPNTLKFSGYSGSFFPPKDGTTSVQFQFKITKRDTSSSSNPEIIIYDRWNQEITHGVAQNNLIYREDFVIVKE